jgi:hypothetical protein
MVGTMSILQALQRALQEDDDWPVIVFVKPQEYVWLKRLERLTGDRPSAIIASMLRDIRVDDEAAHGEDDGNERPGQH